MMGRFNRLDGSQEGWSIGTTSPQEPERMAAVFIRKILVLPLLVLGLSLVSLGAASAKRVDEQSQRASIALVAKGSAAADRGDLPEAQRLFETAIVANPANAAAFTGLGTVHEARDQKNLARKYYLIALSIDPSHAPALSRLAHLELDAGNRTAAEEGLRKLRAFCAACGETQELARALGLGAANNATTPANP
jgi:Tfp pilus assembly protein PilF